jgi:hypothetical protein
VSQDLSRLLSDWPYGAGGNVRKITGEDGKEKMQIRVSINSFHGLLQFECDGRPDAKRPHGREFYLEYMEEKRQLLLASGAPPEEFKLTHAQCKRLFDESTMVYHRYVVLFQAGDFARVVRDTARNMRLFRFVHANAKHPVDREHLECWWPYILRIHHTALAMQRLSDGRADAALEEVKVCRRFLDELLPQENDIFKVELKRSRETLDQIEKEIRARMPLNEMERLERDKQAAIKEQRYEDAARLRDRINSMKHHQPGAPPGSG